jgi:protein-disulfide isomerase
VKAGVSGTPAFFINGRLLSGAQPLEAFKAVIDEELDRLGLQVKR